jgi:hypothetical protein
VTRSAWFPLPVLQPVMLYAADPLPDRDNIQVLFVIAPDLLYAGVYRLGVIWVGPRPMPDSVSVRLPGHNNDIVSWRCQGSIPHKDYNRGE